MYTSILIGFNLRYGPYAHLCYWTLVSDPEPTKIFKKMKSDAQNVTKQAKVISDCIINLQNYNFN